MDFEETEYSKDYLVLKPKDATLKDVFLSLLPSGSTKIQNLIICPDDKVENYTNFKARRDIFFSILVLKFLFSLASLLKILGRFCFSLKRFFFNYIRRSIYIFLTPNRSHITSEADLSMVRVANAPPSNVAWSPQLIDLSTSISKGQTSGIHSLVPDNFACTMPSLPKVRCREWQIMDPNDNTMNVQDRYFRYYSALTIMASKLAYKDHSLIYSVVTQCWKMDLIGCFNFRNDFLETGSTHAFMFEDKSKDVTVVAFKGTSLFDPTDWMIDSNFSFHGVDGVGLIHYGFMQALGYQKNTGWPKDLPKLAHHDFAYYALRRKLRHIAKSNHNAKFIITGHSLGGALATLFVTLLAHHKETTLLRKIQGVYTYGQPRLGDQNFAQFMVKAIETYDIKYYRYVYSFDLVPRVPFNCTISNYKHFGGCIFFNCFYNGKLPPDRKEDFAQCIEAD
ncbi:triacylglycerol lipase OBL1-like [Benincasa hispida]|uniref:triacylglycerol lipase OBL1-like n=1 Tax=Benincasa hispida TaxID=102211 RepID=UPI00190144DE|nr:triacylglycerol lipase OBL1-like [Benincasa hispida]